MPWPRVKKWTKRVLLALLLLLLLIVGAVALILGPMRDSVVRPQVEKILAKALFAEGVELHIDAIRGGLFDGVRVEGVTVTDPDGNVVIAVDAIEADYHLMTLINELRQKEHPPQITIDRVAIEGITVDGHIDADGALNIGALMRPPNPDREPGGSPPELSLPHIALSGVNFTLVDDRTEEALVVGIADFETRASFGMGSDGSMAVGLEQLATTLRLGMLPGLDIPIALSKLDFGMAGQDLTVEIASLSALDTDLEALVGAMTLAPGDPLPFSNISFHLPEIEVLPMDLRRFLPNPKLRIPLTVSLDVEGPANDVSVQLGVTDGEGSVSLDARADLSDLSRPAYRGRLLLVRLQPERWVSLPNVTADATLSLGFDGSGLTPADLVMDARLDVGPSRFLYYDVEGLFLSAHYEDDAVEIRTLEAWALGSHVDLSGTAALDGRVDIEAEVGTDDIGALLQVAALKLPAAGRIDVTLSAEGQIPIDRTGELQAEGADPLVVARDLLSDMSFQVGIEGRALQYGEYRVGSVAFDATGQDGEVPTAEVRTTIRRVDIPGQSVERVDLDAGYDGGRLRLYVDAVQDAQHRATVRGGVRYADGLAQVSFSTVDIFWDGIPLALTRPARVDVSVDESYAPQRFDTPGLALRIAGADIEVAGSYDMRGRPDARVDFEQIDVATITDLVPGLPPISGTVSGYAIAQGSLAAPNFEVHVEAFDIQAMDLPPVSAETTVRYNEGYASMGLSTQAFGSTLVAASAVVPITLNLERQRYEPRLDEFIYANVEIPGVDTAAVAEAFGAPPGTVEGIVGLHAEFDGSIDFPTVSVGLTMTDFGSDVPLPNGDVYALRDVDFDFEAAYDPGIEGSPGLQTDMSLDWEGDRLVTMTGRIAGDVREIVEAPDTFATWFSELGGSLHLSMAEFDVMRIPAEIREPLGLGGGTAGAAVTWAGSTTGATITAGIEFDDVLFRDLLPLSGGVAIAVTQGLQFSVGLTYGDAEPVELELRFDQSLRSFLRDGPELANDLTARLRVDRMPLDTLATAVPSVAGMGGFLAGYLDFTGSLIAPDLHGRFAWRDITLAAGRTAMAGVEVGYENQEVSVDAFLCDAAGEQMRAVAGLRLPYHPVVAFAPESIVPEGLREVALQAFNGVLPPPTDWPLSATLTLENASLGTLLPVGVVEGVLENPRGTIAGDVNVTGSIGDPDIHGELRVEDAAAGIVPLGRAVDRLDFDLIVSNQMITVQNLSMRDAAGSARGSITVLMDDLAPESVTAYLTMDNFYVAADTGAGVFVDGGVLAEATIRDAVVNAHVMLEGLSVTAEENASSGAGPRRLGPNIFFIDEDVYADQVGLRNPMRIGAKDVSQSSMEMHITIENDRPVRIHHSLADMAVDLSLDIDMEDGNMSTDGQVDLREGEVRVTGRVFDVTRGTVEFGGTGSAAFDPYIEVEAVHVLSPTAVSAIDTVLGLTPEGQEGTITVRVHGQLSELTEAGSEAIVFSSDPPMGNDDIIFVLATGRPLSRTGDDGAVSRLTPLLASMLSGGVADRLGVTINIEGGDTEDWHGISRVEGTRALTDDVYVTGAVITDPEDEQSNRYELALQWIIARLRRSTVQTEVRGGDRGEGGVELLYNITVP